jgi:hypothetical protein
VSFRFREESGLRPDEQAAATAYPTQPVLIRNERAIYSRLLVVLLAFLLTTKPLSADDFVEGFDSEKPTWTTTIPRGSGVQVRQHRRNLYIRKTGQAADLSFALSTSCPALFRLTTSR